MQTLMGNLRHRGGTQGSIEKSNLLASLLFVVACGMGLSPARANSLDPAPPRGGDPFAGILDRSKLAESKVPRIENVGAKRLAVILSDETEKHLKWSESATTGWGDSENQRMRGMHGQEYMDRYMRLHKEAYSPQVIVGAVVEPLVKKAKSVDVVQDFSEFAKGDFDLLVVMDVTFVNTVRMGFYYFGSTYQAGSYIKAVFIDRNGVVKGSVESGETRDVQGPPKFLDDAVAMRRDVIARYQAEVDRFLGPDKKTESRASPSAGNSERKTVAERLKELGDLVDRGLVKPEEAAVTRRKILEDL